MTDYLKIARAALADMNLNPEALPATTDAADAIPPKIQGQGNQTDIERAKALLRAIDMRLMELDCGTTVGLWSDRDGPPVRAALRALEFDRLPLRYLDGPGIPDQHKLRSVAGEPVPMFILDEMMKHIDEEPWERRDIMLVEFENAPNTVLKSGNIEGAQADGDPSPVPDQPLMATSLVSPPRLLSETVSQTTREEYEIQRVPIRGHFPPRYRRIVVRVGSGKDR
jgi:hypothetical protein